MKAVILLLLATAAIVAGQAPPLVTCDGTDATNGQLCALDGEQCKAGTCVTTTSADGLTNTTTCDAATPTNINEGAACANAAGFPCQETTCQAGACAAATPAVALATIACNAPVSVNAAAGLSCAADVPVASLATVSGSALTAQPALTATPASPYPGPKTTTSVQVAATASVTWAGVAQSCPLSCATSVTVTDAEPLDAARLACFNDRAASESVALTKPGSVNFTAAYAPKDNGCPVAVTAQKSTQCHRCQGGGKNKKAAAFACKSVVDGPVIMLQALQGTDARVSWSVSAADAAGNALPPKACGACVAKPKDLTCPDLGWQPGAKPTCQPTPPPANPNNGNGKPTTPTAPASSPPPKKPTPPPKKPPGKAKGRRMLA